jgi:hypothetical protein
VFSLPTLYFRRVMRFCKFAECWQWLAENCSRAARGDSFIFLKTCDHSRAASTFQESSDLAPNEIRPLFQQNKLFCDIDNGPDCC